MTADTVARIASHGLAWRSGGTPGLQTTGTMQIKQDVNASINDLSQWTAMFAYLTQLWNREFCPIEGQILSDVELAAGVFEAGTVDDIDYAEVVLNLTNFKGSKSYSTSGYANYGWLSFVTETGYRTPVQWLNFDQCYIKAPLITCRLVKGWLAPGLTGGIRLRGAAGAIDTHQGGSSPTSAYNPYKGTITPL